MKKILSTFLITVMVITSIAICNISANAKAKKIDIETVKVELTAIGKKYTSSKDTWYMFNKENSFSHHFLIPYTSKSVTPSIKIKKGNNYLKKGTDYTIEKIKSIKGAGSNDKVFVKGKGKYKGSLLIRYGIKPKTTGKVFIKNSGARLGNVNINVSTDIECYWKTTKGTAKINLHICSQSKDESSYYYANINKSSKKITSGKYKGYYLYKRTEKTLYTVKPKVEIESIAKTGWLKTIVTI